jgi:hypothetical protein
VGKKKTYLNSRTENQDSKSTQKDQPGEKMPFKVKREPGAGQPASSPKKAIRSYPKAQAIIYTVANTVTPFSTMILDIVYKDTDMETITNGPSIGKPRTSPDYRFDGTGQTFFNVLT